MDFSNDKSIFLLREQSTDHEVFQNMDKFEMSDAERFALSVRIQFPKFSKGFSVSDFTPFIVSNVGVENLVSIGRLSFPNEWQMQLKTMEVREKLIRIGRTKINTRTCWISPLCHSEVRGFIHYIPNAVGRDSIENLLKLFGDVLFIETMKHEKLKKVDSDSRYFAMNLRAGKTMDDVPHITCIDGFTGLITIRGRRPVCFHCREVGHRKIECKKYPLKLAEYCQRKPNPDQKRNKPRGARYKPSLAKADPSDASKRKKRKKGNTKLQGQPQNLAASSENPDQVAVSQEGKCQTKPDCPIVGEKTSIPQQSGAVQTSVTGDLNALEFIETIDKLKTMITNFENVKLSDCNSNATPDSNSNAAPDSNVDATVQEKETGTKKKKKNKKKKKKDAAHSEVP